MAVRTNRQTGSDFLGCTEFPKCRGTRRLEGDQKGGGRASKGDVTVLVAECTDRLPKALSPSRAVDFLKCPRMFYEKSVVRSVVFQASEASMRGTLAHHALEQVVGLSPAERTPDRAVSFLRPHWDAVRDRREQVKLATLSNERIDAMIAEAERYVRAWFDIEDPTTLDPAGVEERVTATLGLAPMAGMIDRIDQTGGTEKQPRLTIVDYKTGRPPGDRFVEEALFPIHVYAAAVASRPGIVVEEVKLIHLGHGTEGIVSRPITPSTNRATTKKFDGIWKDIRTAAATGAFPCVTGRSCDWCDAKPLCPAWN
jgi:putative RecB family exonuclease